MRRFWLAVCLVLGACGGLRAPQPLPSPAGADEPQAAAAVRSLYRVRYQGPDGGGSLRLVLRQASARRFQLQASDTFGRAVWSLDLDDKRVLLIDHRHRQACVSGDELRVPELALRSLPLPAVARVLASRTPVPVPPGADRSEWIDDTGRRWTATWDEDRLQGWTLWQEGEPRLSWLRQADGGVLSHLDGSQFRWRRVAEESLTQGEYRRLEAPPEYRYGTCREGGEEG